MKNEKVYLNENGIEIKVEVILAFEVEELNKSYVAYTINDDDSYETAIVLISEYNQENNQLLPIAFDDKEKVLAVYNDIKNMIFGE